jgi:peptidoglycan/xylan/chitin deacetylase (PgdA/CDA1 family)
MRAILTYHSIDDSGSPISVSPEQFRAHVRFLASGRVRVVPLDQMAVVDGVDRVALTFDDGFANFASEALPLLREHDLPATVFVVANCAGLTNTWDRGVAAIPELPLMGWSTLAALARDGVELGAHSLTHPDLTTVSHEQRQDEIAGSAEAIARHIGRRPTSFAYPYGSANAAAERAASEHYARACGTDLRMLSERDDPFRLPRLDMFYFRDAGRLEGWGSPAFRRRLWLRAQGRRMKRMAARVGAA